MEQNKTADLRMNAIAKHFGATSYMSGGASGGGSDPNKIDMTYLYTFKAANGMIYMGRLTVDAESCASTQEAFGTGIEVQVK
jgi:hypothetical protein